MERSLERMRLYRAHLETRKNAIAAEGIALAGEIAEMPYEDVRRSGHVYEQDLLREEFFAFKWALELVDEQIEQATRTSESYDKRPVPRLDG